MNSLATTLIKPVRIGLAPVDGAYWHLKLYRRHWASLGWLAAGSLLVGVSLFYRGLFGFIVADHQAHVRLIQRGVEEGVWPAHFLFHAIVSSLSGFSHQFETLAWVSLVVLTVCVIAKAWLTYVLLLRNCPRLSTTTFERKNGLSHATMLLLVTAALLLSSPIVRPWWTNRIYLGQLSPNLWHNPTSILCWPFVMLMFFAADAFLRSGRLRELVAVGMLAALSVLAKPNYFLAFAPVYTVLAVRRLGLSRIWLLSQAVLAPAVMILCWQLTASFGGSSAMRQDRHIAWLPLAAWHVYSNSILISLLFSLAFPLSYLLVFWHSVRHRDTLLFAWGVMLCALAWTGCFAELRTLDGTVDTNFNFAWGSHLSIFVLFLVTAIDMLDNPSVFGERDSRRGAGRLADVPSWLLGAHAASGVLWIIRQAIGRGYG